jgi:hypothetical protein
MPPILLLSTGAGGCKTSAAAHLRQQRVWRRQSHAGRCSSVIPAALTADQHARLDAGVIDIAASRVTSTARRSLAARAVAMRGHLLKTVTDDVTTWLDVDTGQPYATTRSPRWATRTGGRDPAAPGSSLRERIDDEETGRPNHPRRRLGL